MKAILVVLCIYLVSSLELVDGECKGRHGYFCYTDKDKKKNYYLCNKGVQMGCVRTCPNEDVCTGRGEFEITKDKICVALNESHWEVDPLPAPTPNKYPVNCTEVKEGYYCYEEESKNTEYYWCVNSVGYEMKCPSGTTCHIKDIGYNNPCY
ncbi:hypothetical protein ENUP19_0054G0026 [Entamoeba nuttalli]|uniref:Cyst wall-specific glycoprotein Jacob n=1 Tax=Entamoeba nuttalli TaxID=412467 RepID=A0ABQ0DC89_9EUKA